jgi:hypothetical protein
MIFNEPIAGPPDRTKPVSGGRHSIVDWQVVYNDDERTVVRDMAIQKGFAPPLKAQWDGKMYRRFSYNMERLSVHYTRYREDQQ